MNGTVLKWYSFLIGVVIYRQTNQSWIFQGKITIRTPPVFKSSCRIPEFSAGDPTQRSISIALVRAIAIHAVRIILAPRFLWYKMTAIARNYGVPKKQ